MSGFQFPATLDGAARKRDKSVSVRLVSNFEMTTEDFAEIDRLMGTTGWALFRPNEIKEADIPQGEVEDRRKTKSARMRASWFVLWDKAHRDAYPDFEQFYNLRAETVIESIKEELRDLDE